MRETRAVFEHRAQFASVWLLLGMATSCANTMAADAGDGSTGCGSNCGAQPGTGGTQGAGGTTQQDAGRTMQPDASLGIDAAVISGSGGQPATVSPMTAPCPITEPQSGARCSDRTGVACTYGTDPFCARIYICQAMSAAGFTFAQLNPAAGTHCTSPANACPQFRPSSQAPCDDFANATCYYAPGITCFCQPGSAVCTDTGVASGVQPSALAWNCNPDPPCPLRQPGAGTPCTPDGLRCAYSRDFCGAGAPMWTNSVFECVTSAWTPLNPQGTLPPNQP